MLLRRLLLIFCLTLCARHGDGYAVLTHEAIIDASWDGAIAPLLKKKYPHATQDQLDSAHAFAYGGAIMPDMGYFPFGNVYFTNLLHYVRSGDFVMNLLHEAQNLNELAFALGSLAHYNADLNGHPEAVNLSVALVYPKVKKKFGDTINYSEDPIAHRRMEFGFDVTQVARGKYAPKAYHDFIGFDVALPVLERAFVRTYGIELKDIYPDLPVAINSFRWSVKTFLPYLTNAAWIAKKNQIEKDRPGITKKEFNASMSRSEYKKEWGKNYNKPGPGAYAIAVLIKIFPRVGLGKVLKFKAPTEEAEKLFLKSFDNTVSDYSAMLKEYPAHKPHLDNIDFDTGKKIVPCEYPLVDETYKKLMLQLPSKPVSQVHADLRKNILEFFKTIPPDVKSDKDAQKCAKALAWLKSGK